MARYLFIDGNYLQEQYRATMLEFLGDEGDLNLLAIKKRVNAFKVFYYDAIDTERTSNETEKAFSNRVKEKQESFNYIRSLDGFHVPEGSVSRSPKARKRRQKEVDVLLAVEALTHAFRKNMDCAILLTGDLDFRPLVEQLIYLGTYVELWCVPLHTSEELHWAVDVSHEISPLDFHEWSSKEFQERFPLPGSFNRGRWPQWELWTLKEGFAHGKKVTLSRKGQSSQFVFCLEEDKDTVVYNPPFDGPAEILERFAEIHFGPIRWSKIHK